MQQYVTRRLIQAVFTVFGVMLITFILFRIIAGDVSAAYVNQKLGAAARQAFYQKHKLDRPALINYHRRIVLEDRTQGRHLFAVTDRHGSRLAANLDLHLSPSGLNEKQAPSATVKIVTALIWRLSAQTPLPQATGTNAGDTAPESAAPPPSLLISTGSGHEFSVPVTPLSDVAALLSAINAHPANQGQVAAYISEWSPANLFDSQFFWHIYEAATFTGRSYATDQTLLDVILERGKFSLAINLPALALGWLLAMVISSLVAYYRDTWVDRIGVLLSVLGMCIPYLAYMLLGQWVLFKIAPEVAVGLSHPVSIYMPVLISVVAGLGGSVRFYRTIILDEISRDYVRTARAKGVPLPAILFVHVLKNCMLPILTNLISTIPFIFMGSLLLERFFGIPGLGDLMLTSITSRDVPIITGLVYLTSVLYVGSLIVTDILYAVFDPRIRLQ
ncbi:MAG: ABC transporter permease [Desulfatitalea sp.]|nr:ABC transporter permease [Desulfatitalea sp.]NNK01778.1 ABC transporter permease [Desulfatitalea sp.]